jgi:hypothetical protein
MIMEQLTVYLDPDSQMENRDDYYKYVDAGELRSSTSTRERDELYGKALAVNGHISCREWLVREKARIEKDATRKAEIREIYDAKSRSGKVAALYVNVDNLNLMKVL